MFICIEGLDGCGKTTQTQLLQQHFETELSGKKVHLCQEPGTTSLGSKIRQLLLTDESVQIDREAEIMLFFAARAQLHEEIINPALERNEIVITDRWAYSTAAYQNFMGTEFESMTDMTSSGNWPDVTFYLLMDLDSLYQHRKSDKIERRGRGYYESVIGRYNQLAVTYDFINIDGTKSIDIVHATILRTLKNVRR